jgi:GTP pyrophosphokinase
VEEFSKGRDPAELDELAVVKYFKQDLGKQKKEQRLQKEDVKVAEVDNILYRFSKCCNPLPGDDIVGYITRGRGVSIHRYDCPNISSVSDREQRLISVKWEDVPSGLYQVEIEISGIDRPGLLSDVINCIAETRTNIASVNAHTDKRRIAHVNVTLDIKNLLHLDYVVDRVKKIRDVTQVTRITRNTDKLKN